MKILVVDDERAARTGMSRVLAKSGFTIIEAEDGEAALAAVEREQPDIVFLDINIPKLDGMKVLARLQKRTAPPLVVMITAFGSERLATEAIRNGAYDYIPKPYEIDELRAAAARAAETLSLRREAARLKAELARLGAYGEIVGASAPMMRIFETVEKVSQTDVTVMIRGESGTGKEVVAREIHRRGPRSENPFVVVNCAAMPETLVESELFGHERGAFTGASARRAGKFETADGGTLLLDEIGDMSGNTQAKVLRVLQDGQFERLGGTKTITADVRLISATHRDLRAGINSGAFREDLYYRLKVVEIGLPPLRERREDIPLLAEHFLGIFNERHGKQVRHVSATAMRRLMSSDWPGNVRQLRNVIESAVVLASSEAITPEDLSMEFGDSSVAQADETDFAPQLEKYSELPLTEAKRRYSMDFERVYITRMVNKHEGNISRAAEELGIKRQNLQQKMRKLGLR